MRLDVREFGIRYLNWINGGAPHANGFGAISTDRIKKIQKFMVHHESLFSEIRIETCPIYSCDTYKFLPISKQLAQNSLE